MSDRDRAKERAMKNYVVIRFNEDGDPPNVEPLTAAELHERLKDNYWGERPVFAESGERIDGSWFVGLVIIEGRIVTPKPIAVVTEYEL